MKLGIYIHIPFCRAKCDYCTFYSVPLSENGTCRHELPERYIERLIKEIDTRSASFNDYSVDTIYFGGGTPSLLEPGAIGRILNRVRDNFNLCDDGIELTIECNPEDFSRDRIL